jgi:CRP-like cAMP-binding protein
MGANNTTSLLHGEVLFRQGIKASQFYMVQSGAIYVLDSTGTTAIKQYFADEMFGIPEVIAGANWQNTAVAYGKTTVRLFSADILFSSLAEMPPSHRDFVQHIASLA